MKRRFSIFASLALLVLAPAMAAAQNEWEEDIQAFEAQDRVNPPAPGGIVFSGSSSIRLWDLPRYFPGKNALNRGFGGCTTADVYYFRNRALINYRPRLIVFFAGENDVADGKSAKDVFTDFQALYTDVVKALPGVRFVYISVKPSPGRQSSWAEFQELNRLVSAYLAGRPGATFVDVWSLLIGPHGEPQPQYFQDIMHLNDRGYAIWTEAIRKLVY